jgi:hypothetical protein
MGAYNWLLHLTYSRRTSLQANMVTTMHFDSDVFDFNSHFFNVQYNLLNYPINSADRYDTRRRQYWRCWPANKTTGGFAWEGTRVQGEVHRMRVCVGSVVVPFPKMGTSLGQ